MQLNPGATAVYELIPQDILQNHPNYPERPRAGLSVSSLYASRWCDWRFQVLLPADYGPWGMELRMHQWCGWSAFAQAPEVFAALATLDEREVESIYEVIVVLEKAGVVEDKKGY